MAKVKSDAWRAASNEVNRLADVVARRERKIDDHAAKLENSKSKLKAAQTRMKNAE